MLKITEETTSWLNRHTSLRPKIAVILGSGLGNLANGFTRKEIFPYGEIPHFPIPTVQGHKGNLIFGYMGDKTVMAMQGRFHFYEGYSMEQLTFPVRVMKAFGIRILILSNAAGGLNPDFHTGDLMIINDHINLFPEHPLRGKNDEDDGPRFPDMSEAYSTRLIKLAKNIAKEKRINLKEGIYAGWQGPTYETPAEYRMLRLLGADACGMSTIPEVIVARHTGIEVFGLSVITNCAITSGKPGKTNHEEVQKTADGTQPNMTLLIKNMIKNISYENN